MKHLKKINEMAGRNIFVDKKVIDVQYKVSEEFKSMVFDYAKKRGKMKQNSYFTYYVPTELKSLDEVKNKNNIIIDPKEPDSDYVYERGYEPITDYLLDNNIVKYGEDVIFLIWW